MKMHRYLRWLLQLSLLFGAFAFAAPITEQQKIDMLIHNIEVMKDARFVRNGSDYDGPAAADHLRLKLRHAGDRIKTAQDFITYLASSSSFSGKPYLIRFNDGHEVESATYLRAMLAKMEHPVAAPIPAAVVPLPVPTPIVAPLPSIAAMSAQSESQKIHALIGDVESMKGARFMRDGHSYSPRQEGRYMRSMQHRGSGRIASAQDFISSYAAHASKSGAERIHFANGQDMDTVQYLRTRLAMIEHSATAIRPIVASPQPTH